MGYIAFWSYFGILYLLILTYQDHFKKMLVDDRYNWFMMGISMSLISHKPVSLPYIITLIVLIIFLRVIMSKYKVLGDGDANCLTWLFYGYGLISPYTFMSFAITFLSVAATYFAIKIYIFKIREYTPFFIVILASHVSTIILFKVW